MQQERDARQRHGQPDKARSMGCVFGRRVGFARGHVFERRARAFQLRQSFRQAQGGLQAWPRGFGNIADDRSGPSCFLSMSTRQARGFPNIERGVKTAGHAFDRNHGFLQQQKLGLGCHVKLVGHVK